MKQHHYESVELSYYGLTLLSFLKGSHPDKANDNDFIITRADLAAETYEKALLNGHTQQQSEELATGILFKGLHFSQLDTVITILWNEFSDDISQDDVRKVAWKLLPHLQTVFDRYELSDDFAYSLQYEQLYTKLVGTILIYFEEYGI